MEIYVITKGDYSDYHICAVTTDKEKAEKFKKIYSDKWDEARIELYNTEDTEPLLENKKIYEIVFYKNGDVYKTGIGSHEYDTPGITELNSPFWKDKDLMIKVFADDMESAIKIAAEKRAKYLAEKIGLLKEA